MNLREFEKELDEYHLKNERVIIDALKLVLSSLGELKADDGSSQIEQHILLVAYEVIKYLLYIGRIDPELVAVALLHDVLEDRPTIDEDELQKILVQE